MTSSTRDKSNLLQSDRLARLFVEVLYHYRAQGKFRLHEFVVMPDHFHVLLTLENDISIERAVQFVKGGFAFRAGKEIAIRAPFRRYPRNPRSDSIHECAPTLCISGSIVIGPTPAIGPRSSRQLLPSICPSDSATTQKNPDD